MLNTALCVCRAACSTLAKSTYDQWTCHLGKGLWKVMWPLHVSWVQSTLCPWWTGRNGPSGGPRSANLKHTLPCPRWNMVIISFLLSPNNPHGTSCKSVLCHLLCGSALFPSCPFTLWGSKRKVQKGKRSVDPCSSLTWTGHSGPRVCPSTFLQPFCSPLGTGRLWERAWVV